MALGVIGIPKTIDNDVSFVQKTFGFETAVSERRRAIYAPNTEAEAAPNGIGLVKLMGRDSGFIDSLRPIWSWSTARRTLVLFPKLSSHSRDSYLN